jgi:hypothetical protein
VTGFRRGLLEVRFDGGDLDGSLEGLWIRLSRMNVGQLREISRIADKVKSGELDEFDVLCDKIGDALVEWNWCDPISGEPVDARAQGAIDALDADVMVLLVEKWQELAIAVPKDLGKESGSMPDSLVRTTRVELPQQTDYPDLSQRLANLPTHSAHSPS